MGADLDVIQDRHRSEQSRTLEGAADAERGNVRGRASAQGSSLQPDVAAHRPIEPAQAIEQGGLAGAIRPNQSDDAAFACGEGDGFERHDAAEAHGHVGDRQ